jgi:hypothetical protein
LQSLDTAATSLSTLAITIRQSPSNHFHSSGCPSQYFPGLVQSLELWIRVLKKERTNPLCPTTSSRTTSEEVWPEPKQNQYSVFYGAALNAVRFVHTQAGQKKYGLAKYGDRSRCSMRLLKILFLILASSWMNEIATTLSISPLCLSIYELERLIGNKRL